MNIIVDNLITELHKMYNINFNERIFIENNTIKCVNRDDFDFGVIFIENFWKSNIHDCKKECNARICQLYSPIGTSEDNNLMTLKNIADILNGYYCTFICLHDEYIIKPFLR